jgi:DNA (cytosine-5)-methyltransferase 1
MMRFGTFCSGIAAPEMAWTRLGWEPQWFSEIEPFPCAVLAHHYPGVPNLGDMENISGEQLRGTVDVVCAGTPCQSFSVAGLRGGMDDPRGNLALVFLRLVDAIRPAWVVWENVPGVLSSNDGRDFGAFIGGLGQLGYGFAYRVLDAQYVGVPQRRRRVFVVGYLGDWRRAAAVLFERHSLSGNPAPSREAGAGVAASLTGSLGRRGGVPDNGETEGQLIAADSFSERDTSSCLTSHGQRIDPDTETFIIHGSEAAREASETEVSSCLTKSDRGAFNQSNCSQTVVVHTLTSNGDAHTRDEVRQISGDGQIAGALGSDEGMKQRTYIAFQERGRQIAAGMAVRRLTPRECERLQGFPDDYTLIPFRGKPAADGPRYRAIGNSMAVPVLEWIGRRIAAVERVLFSPEVA